MKAITPRFFKTLFVAVMIFTLVLAPSSRITAQEGQRGGDYTIRRDVNLVVLPVTVLDKRGQFVTDLPPENFSVFENNILQKIDIAQHEDVPVSLGLVIDNSGSMGDKREGVNEAAITFVETSNIEDEMFVVNFSEELYIDQEFTASITELKEAFDRATGGGNTALYNAIIGSMDYLQKSGKRDRKVLLVITDGEDRASTKTLEQTLAALQKNDTIVYIVGILGEGGEARRAKRVLQQIADVSGGLAFFPSNNRVEIKEVCEAIAKNIRNQYTIGYYSSASSADLSFRKVQVKVKDSQGKERKDLAIRTRTGYFPKPAPVKK